MEKLFNMTQKDLSRYNLVLKAVEKSFKQVKAAELLGVSDRHFRRLVKTYRAEGLNGLLSKKRGKPSNYRMKDDIKSKIVEKLKQPTKIVALLLLGKNWSKKEKVKVSLESVRKIMVEQGLWEFKKRKRLKVYQQRNR